jgi:hypothetical protein
VTEKLVWIRHELPWVGHGFVHAVRSESAQVLKERLTEVGFEIWEIEPGQVFSYDTFFEKLYQAMMSPMAGAGTGTPSMSGRRRSRRRSLGESPSSGTKPTRGLSTL